MMSLKERRKEKKGFDNLQQYPKVPSGFQCFECGEQFDTNEDRMQHLEKGSHGGNYDTGSPQEREDTRRLQRNDKNYLGASNRKKYNTN